MENLKEFIEMAKRLGRTIVVNTPYEARHTLAELLKSLDFKNSFPPSLNWDWATECAIYPYNQEFQYVFNTNKKNVIVVEYSEVESKL